MVSVSLSCSGSLTDSWYSIDTSITYSTAHTKAHSNMHTQKSCAVLFIYVQSTACLFTVSVTDPFFNVICKYTILPVFSVSFAHWTPEIDKHPSKVTRTIIGQEISIKNFYWWWCWIHKAHYSNLLTDYIGCYIDFVYYYYYEHKYFYFSGHLVYMDKDLEQMMPAEDKRPSIKYYINCNSETWIKRHTEDRSLHRAIYSSVCTYRYICELRRFAFWMRLVLCDKRYIQMKANYTDDCQMMINIVIWMQWHAYNM